jgi:hypothetical protein
MSRTAWLALMAAGSIALGASAVVRAQACRVVPGQTLETFYPVMPGWERGQPKSETDMEESVSRTTVDFDRKVSTISVEIMDSCRNPDVLLLLMESLKQLPPASRGTVVRHITVNGFPGYQEWTAEAGNGEVHVLVGGRFMVKVTASTTDLATLENAARLIPMQKLAAIK